MKSPFLIQQNFIPQKICQEIVDLTLDISNETKVYSEPLSHNYINIHNSFLEAQIGSHFNTKIINSIISLDSYTESYIPEFTCASTVRKNNMWFRNKDYDFETVIFLKSFLETPPIDTNFEVYGGKLEFPSFGFGLNPERGTSVTFPCVPNFLNAISEIKIGKLDVLRIFHRSDTMYIYESDQFKGTYIDWFSHLS